MKNVCIFKTSLINVQTQQMCGSCLIMCKKCTVWYNEVKLWAHKTKTYLEKDKIIQGVILLFLLQVGILPQVSNMHHLLQQEKGNWKIKDELSYPNRDLSLQFLHFTQ